MVACHEVMWASVTDLGRRRGTPLEGSADQWWRASEALFRYLGGRAAEWWVAEEPRSAELVGYARSIERDGLVELTEFFVRPGQQARGVGGILLERTLPARGDKVVSIVATIDARALTRYYRAGTVARFPIFTLGGEPAAVEPRGDLTPIALDADAVGVDVVGDIERAVLGHARGGAEVRWFLEQGEGYLYRRHDTVVGSAFVGRPGVGPIAALSVGDLPDMLLHVEGRAHALGVERLDFEVPAPNAVAIHHLLSRGFRFDSWVNVLMTNRPFGQFDRFIGCPPPMFL